mgnify:CR=1 FL=1
MYIKYLRQYIIIMELLYMIKRRESLTGDGAIQGSIR